MEIQRYLSVVFRWLWLILAGTILAGVGSYFLSRNLDPIYQASTTILIRQSSNPVSPIESNRIITSSYGSLLA
ncbi:MAG: Wzz/FepE/Etk N-terminal domain-containing protein, partial [Chloroflexota bacterium]|nr:Wzz/FepE/Etk N-terminal domain-containing protein [Chloroflexota bacterium]